MNTVSTYTEQMEHSMRRVREYLNGEREVLRLKDFEGLINLINEEGWLDRETPIELVDVFTNFYERLSVTCQVSAVKEREHYLVTLSAVSLIDGIEKNLSCNTVLVYSFKDDRLHQSIDLGDGVIVKSTVGFKEPSRFASIIRTRLANTQDYNFNAHFRVDRSLLENNQLVRAAGYDTAGNFISVTGTGKVAIIEDFIATELGYVPLDKEMSNVFN